MSNINLNNLAAASAPVKESETIKQMIAQNHDQIAKLKTRRSAILDKLHDKRTAPMVNHDQAAEQLSSIDQGIQNLQNGIASLEHRLPQVEMVEATLDRLAAQAAKDATQRDRETAQAHEHAVKGAALIEWLKTPGQTAQSFEIAWPQISHQIAMQNAVEAASAAAQVPQTPNFAAKTVTNWLAAKYAPIKPVNGGN